MTTQLTVAQETATNDNKILNLQMGDDSKFYLVDINKPINADGNLNLWKVWVKNNLPVQLAIFRKIADNWSMIGKSEIVHPSEGLNEVTLSHPIAVKAGDCVGVYYPHKKDSTPEKKANIEIVDIFYKGNVKWTQSDEYIEIRNSSNETVDLSNWKVTSSGKYQIFTFPEKTTLAAGESIRVYTNEVHQESGGFSFGSKTAIWNDKGDTGKLLNAEGQEMSSFSY
ncbi:MAG: lamin tail domain-containing protein [Crocosphaera sp.]|nr:lamin tail domain-containing protein [Crocosphaera sp.]